LVYFSCLIKRYSGKNNIKPQQCLVPTKLSFYAACLQKKTRNDEKLFVVEGIKLVDELLVSACKIHSIYGTDAWIESHYQLLDRKQADYYTITQTELERVSQLNTPNQVFAVVHQPDTNLNLNTLQGKMVLALDNVADPGNLGTIIRIADWFGIDTIICSENTVELFNNKVVQASMGSFFRVKVRYAGLVDVIAQYKQLFPHQGIYAAVLGGTDLYQSDIKSPCMLVMGSESHGISADVQKLATHTVTIPPYAGSGAESLNVAVSTAILCAEVRRKG
jgi:RNA methyltransferase, TrmH family